jgi:iron-sulfur cluster repair protein YtfE (RIC family)
MLVRIEPRIEAGFELLETDHHLLDPLLHGLAERTNAVLRAGPAPGSEMQRLHSDLDRFAGFLNRHLTDEEDIIVPIILEHGERIS